MSLTKAQRAIVYAMFGGKCAYCGCVLPEKRWHADHIEPIFRETRYVAGKYVEGKYQPPRYVQTGNCSRPDLDRFDNYYPSCHRCNIEKSCCTVEDFRLGLERKIQSLRNNSAAFRHAERYGLVAVMKEKVVFYFETFAVVRGESSHDDPIVAEQNTDLPEHSQASRDGLLLEGQSENIQP